MRRTAIELFLGFRKNMIFSFNLKKAAEIAIHQALSQGRSLTSRGVRFSMKVSTKVGVPLVAAGIGLAAPGCGKGSSSNTTVSQVEPEDSNSVHGIFKNDELRSRMIVVFRKAIPTSRPSSPVNYEIIDRAKLETLERVTDIAPAGDKVEVERMEKLYRARPVFSSEWVAVENLKPIFFKSVEEVRDFCAKASGQMEKVKTVVGEIDACKITQKFGLSFRNSKDESLTREGSGSRWLAAVPFGWIKTEWSSSKRNPNDLEISVSSQALSYRKAGKDFSASTGNAPQGGGWSLSDCE